MLNVIAHITKLLVKYRKHNLELYRKLIILWGVFIFSFITRIFRFSYPKSPVFDENCYLQQLLNISSHNVSRPIIGDLIVMNVKNIFSGNSLTNSIYSKNGILGINKPYLIMKVINIFLSSCCPTLIAASLMVIGISDFVSFFCGLLICFEFSGVVRSRMISGDSLFLFFCSMVLFLNSLLINNFKYEYSVLIACSIFTSLAFVTDFSGLVMVIYSLRNILFGKKNIVKNILIFSSILIFFISIDLGLEVKILHLNLKTILSQKIINMKDFEQNKHPFYLFPLWKFAPKLLWKSNNQKYYLLNNPITLLLCFLFSVLRPDLLSSRFYLYSIYLIWLIKKPTNCIDYQLCFFFGVLSIGKAIQSLPLCSIISSVFLIFNILIFSLWSPWVYCLIIKPEVDHSIDIWNH